MKQQRAQEILDRIHELSDKVQKLSNPVALNESSDIRNHMTTWEELKERGAAYDETVELEKELCDLNRHN